MIKRYILHFEFHWGYRPRISIRRMPRPGDRIMDNGMMGTLEACPNCDGDGLLHRPDEFPEFQKLLQKPISDETVHRWQGPCCIECEAHVSWCDHPHISIS